MFLFGLFVGAIVSCCTHKVPIMDTDHVEQDLLAVLRKVGAPYVCDDSHIDENRVECPICIEEATSDALTTLCKHTIHRACLVEYWRTTYPALKCPVCRF